MTSVRDDTRQRNQAAVRAMAAGDLGGAQAILLEAVARDRSSVASWLNLAAVRRQQGDVDGAHAALREALKLDNRNFPALLMTATLLEGQGLARQAAVAYGIALVQAPPANLLDPPTLRAVMHGREVHRRYTSELDQYIRADVADTGGQCTPAERRRLDRFIGTTLRTRERYQQQPLEYYYPGLPSIEFYERDEFPWLPEFEAATAGVQRDLARVLAEEAGALGPYIHYDEHLPLDQWRELNHNPRWSAYHFFEGGLPIAGRLERSPATAAAIALLPQPQVPLRSPVAMFSVLRPRTHIPPHTGVSNFRLVVHLPLLLPGKCRFRVGGETREWRPGEAWVFDDTLEHEAWNDSDQTRVILICDIWSPRLSPEERAAIARVIAATDAFNGTRPAADI